MLYRNNGDWCVTYKARLIYKANFRKKIRKFSTVVEIVDSLLHYCFGRYTFSGKTNMIFRELGSIASIGT